MYNTLTDIPGYEGLYAITEDGRIWCHPKKTRVKGFWRKTKTTINGYIGVGLTKEGKQKDYFVHRLVAITYIENIDSKPYINHKNGVKSDNRIENLEWCTNSENQIHAYRVLGSNYKTHEQMLELQLLAQESRKIKIRRYTQTGDFIDEFPSLTDASKKLGISCSNICSHLKGKLKTAGGYLWQYTNA